MLRQVRSLRTLSHAVVGLSGPSHAEGGCAVQSHKHGVAVHVGQLFRAVQRDDAQTVQMLASLGADVLGARNGEGQTARSLAAQHKSSRVMVVLDQLATDSVGEEVPRQSDWTDQTADQERHPGPELEPYPGLDSGPDSGSEPEPNASEDAGLDVGDGCSMLPADNSETASASGSAGDPSLAGSPELALPEAEGGESRIASSAGQVRKQERGQDLARHEQELARVRAQMVVAREEAQAAASRAFAQETQQLVVSLQNAVQAQAAAEATAKKANADHQKVEKQKAAIVAAKEQEVLHMRRIASEAEDAAQQALAASAKLAEEIAHQTSASRVATEAAEEEKRRLEVEVRKAVAAEADCAAKLQATECTSRVEKQALAKELEQVRQRQKDAEEEWLKATRVGEATLKEVREHARLEADRLRDETMAVTREHEMAVAKAQAQADACREALEQGKLDALKMVDDSVAVTAQTKEQLSAAKASAQSLAAEVEMEKLRGIELATEATFAAAEVEAEKSASNARLLTAESERLALVAQVSELALQREEAEAVADTAMDEVSKLAAQVEVSRAQLEAAEQAQAEAELQNARLATELKEAVATQLATEEARCNAAMEISASMGQISASFVGNGSSCTSESVEEGGKVALSSIAEASPTSSPTSSLRWNSECAWVELLDDEGDPYYHNANTQETTWEMPTEFRRQQLQQEIAQAKRRTAAAALTIHGGDNKFTTSQSDAAAACSRVDSMHLRSNQNRGFESPVSKSSFSASGGSSAPGRGRSAVSPDRDLAAPPPGGPDVRSSLHGLPPQETMAAAAAREAKMAAARVYAAKAAAAALRRTASPQSPARRPALSPARAEAEQFQQDIRGFLRARRADKQRQELQLQLQLNNQHGQTYHQECLQYEPEHEPEPEPDPTRHNSPSGLNNSSPRSPYHDSNGTSKSSDANARLHAYVNALDKVGLLDTLTPGEKLRLAESLSTEEFGAGDNIVTAGDVADCMYLLESGSANAVKPSSSMTAMTGSTKEIGKGAVDVLKTYSRGDFFGELALGSPGGVRHATVVATSFSTVVLKLPRDAFQNIVAMNDGAAAKLEQEKAAYAERSARLLAAARQPVLAADRAQSEDEHDESFDERVDMDASAEPASIESIDVDGERQENQGCHRQGRRAREENAETIQRVWRGLKARRHVAKIQVSYYSALRPLKAATISYCS